MYKKYRKLPDDDPAWHEDQKFLSMTPSQRYRFRKAQRKLVNTNKKVTEKVVEKKKDESLPIQEDNKVVQEYKVVQDEEAVEETTTLTDDIWYLIIEILINESRSPEKIIRDLLNLASTCVQLYNIVNCEPLWINLAKNCAGSLPESTLERPGFKISPVNESDSWKNLAIRLLPIGDKRNKEKLITKTTIIKEIGIPEKLIWGRLAFKEIKSPYGSRCAPMLLFRESSALQLAELFNKEVSEKKSRSQKILTTRKSNTSKREAKFKELNLDKECYQPFFRGPNEYYFGPSKLIKKYISSGKSLEELLERKERYDQLALILSQHSLVIRTDSVLCRNFIVDGVGNIEKIVKTMIEMDFLHSFTKYQDIYRKNFNATRHDYEGNLGVRISKETKREIYQSLDIEDFPEAPEWIKYKINKYI